MSSIKYIPKDREEVCVIVDNYIESLEKSGISCDNKVLLKKLNDLKERKEQDLFDRHFGDMHPANLIQAAEIIKENAKVVDSKINQFFKSK